MEQFNFNKLMIHGGIYHADDLMVAAMARTINPEIKIERAFQVPVDLGEDVIVADIGGGRYDHHQATAETRENGKKYAACGLFFRDFWPWLFKTEEEAKEFDEKILQPIELMDNYGPKFLNWLNLHVNASRPAWDDEGPTMETRFEGELDFFCNLLSDCREGRYPSKTYKQHIMGRSQMELDARNARAKSLLDSWATESPDGIIVLQKYVPTFGYTCPGKQVTVAAFCNRNQYNIQTLGDYKLPESWLSEKPTGCTFVHQGRFLAAFSSFEDAMAAAQSL